MSEPGLSGQETAAENPVSSKTIREAYASNELGDGILYSLIHRGKLVFVPNSGQWYVWDDHAWRRDDMGFHLSAVEDVVDLYRNELVTIAEELSKSLGAGRNDEAEKLQKLQTGMVRRISRLRTTGGRKACVEFAATNRDPISIPITMMDRDPWVLACANGVIDLKTGELRAGRPDEYISKRAPVEWKGINEPAPTWGKTLVQIYNGDQSVVDYVRRLLGYGITGDTSTAVFPVLEGRGRNGKSVIIETLFYTLGDYAGPIPAEMLLDGGRASDPSKPSPEIMDLKGLRLAVASETDDGRRFSTARVKWLTGSDTLKARGLHDRQMTPFRSTHLLVLLTNHKPNASASDYAFWQRAVRIPHLLSFVDGEPEKDFERKADRTLPGQLRAEASGILAWLVRGCLEWQREGLNPPESITKATYDYRKENDPIGDFVREWCSFDPDPEACTNASDLYDAYCIWRKRNGQRFNPTSNKFGRDFNAVYNLPKKHRVKGDYYFGILLTPEAEDALTEEVERQSRFKYKGKNDG